MSAITALPEIIQGGMGIGVSSWKLAREVSLHGALGVVSGTAIDSVIARRLQDGDSDESIRRALAQFPDQKAAHEILRRYFLPGGRAPTTAYIDVPKLTIKPSDFANQLLIASTFVEVWLAKEGHDGVVGMNLLEKIQMAIPAQVYGAILANVDYILIGAGIPAELPKIIRDLSANRPTQIKIDVVDSTRKYLLKFNPSAIADVVTPLKQPKFLAIISSHALAAYLNKDQETRPDGFIVEGFIAGGHNAPPRSKDAIGEDGQSKFTEADVADLEKVKKTGLPFWLAGGYNTPAKLGEAKAAGATGIQVGTLFALCDESGITPEIRSQLRAQIADHSITVRTDPTASPTGFPFKIVELEGTLSSKSNFIRRDRICDLGYLRIPFETERGGIGYRCSGEPKRTFEFKKGSLLTAANSHCLCNALMADIGMPQVRPSGAIELPLVTLGADLSGSDVLATQFPEGWSAVQALEYLRS